MGVFVVAGLAVLISLTMGQGEAKPKDALALIFGIIGAYLVLLFLFQLRDLSTAEAADAEALDLSPAQIENPATLDEPKLWASLAVGPIDAGAVRARKATWSTTRSSVHTAMLVCLLIFLTVPPIYLFDTFLPLVVGLPAIAGVALWKSVRLLARGGDLDRAYENAGQAVAPLGLALSKRPTVTIEPKGAAPYRPGPGVHGALVLDGKRHGRPVTVRMPADGGVRAKSEVLVEAGSPEFAFRARDGRLKAEEGAPAALAQVLKRVPNSTRWNGVRGSGGDGGIEVERKGTKSGDWLLDLWLAERLADALAR